jgi:hypothetical protein
MCFCVAAGMSVGAAEACSSATSDGDAPPLIAAVSPSALSPAFSRDIHDYAIRCDTTTDHLTLDLSPQTGETVSVAGSDTAPTSSKTTVTVSFVEDQAVLVHAAGSNHGSVDDYSIRCLPHDFPSLSVTRHPLAAVPAPGWYLIGNLTVVAGRGAFAMVVDGNGTPVWYRRAPKGVVDVDRLSDNTISFTPLLGSGFGTDSNGQFEIHHLDTSETEYVRAVGTPTDHHELLALSNGNRMVLSYPMTPHVDLTGLQDFGPEATIADCAIQELDPSGVLVWQWLASDHLDAAKESTAPSVVMLNGTTVYDVFHCNSIDVGSNGDLLLSTRHADAIFYVSKATGAVVWKMGGTPFNKDNAEIIAIQGDSDEAFYRQHDARFHSDGQISLFDDHGATSGPARGVVFSIDLAAGKARVAWEYAGAVNSGALGSFRRYPDGSSLIGWGSTSDASGLVFSEIDAAGHDMLDLSFEPGANSYRAIKVPLTALDVDVLRKTAGLP